MILFLNFYRQSYLKSKRDAAAAKKASTSENSTKTSYSNGTVKKHN